jgi:hypothetical protein
MPLRYPSVLAFAASVTAVSPVAIMYSKQPQAKGAYHFAAAHQSPRCLHDLGLVKKIRLANFIAMKYNQVAF